MVPGATGRSRAQGPQGDDPCVDAEPVSWRIGEAARIGEDVVTITGMNNVLSEARVRGPGGQEIRVDSRILEKL